MKKILLTNNTKLINLANKEYDEVYTDSPYVVEYYKDAIYLDTLLGKNFDETINNICDKGNKINKDIISIFFPDYKNENIVTNILHIETDYTNIFMNIVKLFKLIELYPNDEITIGITNDELYDKNSPEVLGGISNRFANVYYWIADLRKMKNVYLRALFINGKEDVKKIKPIEFEKDIKKANHNRFSLGHQNIDSWFLRLADLDKKVLVFNLLKKMKLINKNKAKIYLYKKSTIIREMEPYLYDLGFNLINMPAIKFKYQNIDNDIRLEKLKEILDQYFENDLVSDTFKLALFEMYKKRIKYYLQKEIYTQKYISKLDKSIKIILTSTINGYDSDIFAKQLQQDGYKIINVMHGFSTGFLEMTLVDFFECAVPDMTLCFNHSEIDVLKKRFPKKLLYPISMVQEAKKKRFRVLKRFFVNKILKLNDDINIFYPSLNYPYNNVTSYTLRMSDKKCYEFEKNMILLLSDLNKRAIYKHYPMRGYIDANPLIEYAKSFKNIKVIDKNFDFRFVSSAGNIFILGSIGTSSTITWMLGENKPIIYLHTKDKLSATAKEILYKTLIVVDINDDNWINNLTSILNKPYEELVKMWKDKKIYRDQFDVDWFLGTNLHSGKLGSNYVNKYILENTKN
jgi:hypothetical protein